MTGVDEAQKLRVSFAPQVHVDVMLSDIAWAKKRIGAGKASPSVLVVGDVARFRVFQPEPEEDAKKKDAAADASVAEFDAGDAAGEEAALPPRRVALYQIPEVEGSLFALDIATGEVLALVGGYDYGRSQFDRAVQARRQPGSAFKPFVYATALTRGLTALSVVQDQPYVQVDPTTGEVWSPQNYDHKTRGPVQMREALARSLNLATINLMFRVGLRPIINFAHASGSTRTSSRTPRWRSARAR